MQEGHGLAKGHSVVRAEGGCAGFACNAVFHGPGHGVSVIGIGGYVREAICWSGLIYLREGWRDYYLTREHDILISNREKRIGERVGFQVYILD